MKKKYEDFNQNIRKQISSPVLDNVYSVEIKIFEEPMKYFEKDIADLLNRNPGPLTMFTFLEEEYLFIRFESLFVILNLHQSIKNKFEPFKDTEYIPICNEDIAKMKKYFNGLKIREDYKLDQKKFVNNVLGIRPNIKHPFFEMTFKPLFFYLIYRFDYPKSLFQDDSFFEFRNKKISEKNDYFNDKQKSGHDIDQSNFFHMKDFIRIEDKKDFNINKYHIALYIPTFHLFVLKYSDEYSEMEKEIDFHQHNNYWLFIKCYGYFYNGKSRYLVYKYMCQENFINYCKSANRTSRLINLLRLLFAMDYLHSKGYIYRNLRASKVILDDENLAYLSNFSYVWKADEEGTFDSQVGSPIMMSNEQNTGFISFSTDVYSFGKMILLLFNGEYYVNKEDKSYEHFLGEFAKLKDNYRKLNEVVDSCLKENGNARITIKEFINQIDEIIRTFPDENIDKQKVYQHLKLLKEKSLKYIVWKYNIKNFIEFFKNNFIDINANDKNTNDDKQSKKTIFDFPIFQPGKNQPDMLKDVDINTIRSVNELFDINLFKVESYEKDKDVLNDFFKNSFAPFIVVGIEKVNDQKYLFIAFEASFLICKLSILEEDNHFYEKKLMNLFQSNLFIYTTTEEQLNEFSKRFNTNKMKIMKDEIFFRLIKSFLLKSKNEQQLISDEYAIKAYPLIIGYSIKRFYFRKEQFNDPYFFNYDQICRYTRDRYFYDKDFYILETIDTSRNIGWFIPTRQLFTIFVFKSKKALNLPSNKYKINHPSISLYFGYLQQNENLQPDQDRFYYYLYEITNDYSLNQLLNLKSPILEDPTIKCKIVINSLCSYDFLNRQLIDDKKISENFIDSKYIFIDVNLNVKIIYPFILPDETIEKSMMNFSLILLSLYYSSKGIDLSCNIAENNFEKIPNNYSIPEDKYPLYFIYNKCVNIQNESVNNKKNAIYDIIGFIFNDSNLFGPVNQFSIANEFKILKINYERGNYRVSFKIKGEFFFNDSTLPKDIKDFTIYYLLLEKEIFFNELLQRKTSPLISFFLDKIEGQMTFIMCYSKVVIIYHIFGDLSDFETFLLKFNDKVLFPINETSLYNFQKIFQSISNTFNLVIDPKLLEKNIDDIATQLQKNQNQLDFSCLKVVILYLIKRYDFKSKDFDDSSFQVSPINEFTTFNKNDFFLLHAIGIGATSTIILAIHKSTFHVFVIKNFKTDFDTLFQRELGIYSKYFETLGPFIVKCYGYIRNSFMLVFDYMANGTLNIIREKKLIDDTINTKVVLRILSSIAFLHSERMIYKDLKPENILFNHDFEPFLTDLGAISNEENVTSHFGNPLFAAPEFLNDKEYNNKVDVYSFGLLLFYICTDNEDFITKNQIVKQPLIPTRCHIYQNIYTQSTKEDQRNRRNSIDLLFEIIYNELFFPNTNKDEIYLLVNQIVTDINFKDQEIYKPFFIMKGIAYQEDFELALELIEESELQILENELLCNELANIYMFDIKDYQKAFEYYSIASDKGNYKAENMIGIGYYTGIFGEKNFSKALDIFDMIKDEDSDALNNYAYLLAFGSDDLQDKEFEDDEKRLKTAVSFFHKAIKKSNKKESFINLGDIYSKTDIPKAIRFYIQACDFNFDIPYLRLADLCVINNGVINKKGADYYYEKALKINKNLDTYRQIYNYYLNARLECSEEFVIECLIALKEFFQIGLIYYNRNDLDMAKEYFLKASKKGNSHAQNYLGIIYFNEERKKGLLSDNSQSLKYFKKAAKDKNNFIAQYNLGLIYYIHCETKSYFKAFQLFFNTQEKLAKSNVKLGQIYENAINIEKAIYFYEKALELSHDGYPSLLNKIGLFYATGDGVAMSDSKGIQYFKKAHRLNYLAASNNLGLILMHCYKKGNSIDKAYGHFYYLHKYYKYILSSCNLGFYYEESQRIDDSIPYFEEALKNFKRKYMNNESQQSDNANTETQDEPTLLKEVNDNILGENNEQDECLFIIIFYTYMQILSYYLSIYDTNLNSKRTVECHFKDLLTFYRKFNLSKIIKNLNDQNDIAQKEQINTYFDDFFTENISKSFLTFKDLKFLLSIEIKVLKKEIHKNQLEILFCHHRRSKNDEERHIQNNLFYSYFLDLQGDQSINSISNYVNNVFSDIAPIHNFQIDAHFSFLNLYPEELCLGELYSPIKFFFISKLNSKIKGQIKRIAEGAKYFFYETRSHENSWIFSLIVNNYFWIFFPTSINQMLKNQDEIFLLLPDQIKIKESQVSQYFSQKEFDTYLAYIHQFLLKNKTDLKMSFIKAISYYSLLHHYFYPNQQTNSKTEFDSSYYLRLKEIEEHKYKIINIQTNSVFMLKENESKEERKEEINFYSYFSFFQSKMIVPKLIGKVEYENSLIYEYFDNFSDFFDEKWSELDNTNKTLILAKMVNLIHHLHLKDVILCGLQLDSFSIRNDQNGFDIRVNDLYHFHKPDYSVLSDSEYVAPEIKEKSDNISYLSDIFSLGKIAEKLGFFSKELNIFNICISENPNDRPNTFTIMIYIYSGENYFENVDTQIVNSFLEAAILESVKAGSKLELSNEIKTILSKKSKFAELTTKIENFKKQSKESKINSLLNQQNNE